MAVKSKFDRLLVGLIAAEHRITPTRNNDKMTSSVDIYIYIYIRNASFMLSAGDMYPFTLLP